MAVSNSTIINQLDTNRDIVANRNKDAMLKVKEIIIIESSDIEKQQKSLYC